MENFVDRRQTDSLTKLKTENFLKERFYTFKKENPNGNFCIIDLSKFKAINDNLGHKTGDNYLVLFATVLKEVFGSIDNTELIRLHGDEFVVLSTNTSEELKELFNSCQTFLKIYSKKYPEKYPRTLEFNVGSCILKDDLDSTLDLADKMMYFAKQRQMIYQPFDEALYKKEFLPKIEFIKKLEVLFKNDSFRHSIRDLHNIDGSKIEYSQLYTRDDENNSIYYNNRYQALKENSQLLKLDTHNINHIFEKYDLKDKKVFLSIDAHSLPLNPIYINKIKESIALGKVGEVVFSINLEDVTIKEHEGLINVVTALEKDGFKVCLDHFSSYHLPVWERLDKISYIKFDNLFWKRAMDVNSKSYNILNNLVRTFIENDSKVMFTVVETKKEYDFIKSVAKTNAKDVIVSGNYFSLEEELTPKKDILKYKKEKSS